MSKYRKMFVDEAREHLATAAGNLVKLEKEPGDKDLIHELFRNAHSIKGMAASLGYDAVKELAHKLEDLLDLSRSDKLVLDSSTIDILLKSIDFLERLVTEVEDDQPLTSPERPIADLVAIIDDQAASGEIREGRGDGKSAQSGKELPASDAGRVLKVTFRVANDSFSPGARGYLAVRALETHGEVQKLRPEIGAIKSGRYGRVVDADVCTKSLPEDIARALSEMPEIIEVRVRVEGDPDQESSRSSRSSEGTPLPETAAPTQKSSTIRVKTEALDRFVDAVGELILNKGELREIARDLDSDLLQDGLSRMEASLEELKRQAMGIRLTPLDRVFGTLPRMVRDLARSNHKKVAIDIRGGALELDRAVVDALNDPVIHLVRNAVDHGMEDPEERQKAGKSPECRILMEAYREKDLAVIHIEDDGRGVDLAKVRQVALEKGLIAQDEAETLGEEATLALLFRPGMSTSTQVSEISGRGVGLDAVKSSVQGLGGSVSIRSRPGLGTQVTLRIPFSAAILRALIVRVGEEVLAIPIPKVYQAFEVGRSGLMPGTPASGISWYCRVGEDLLPAWQLAEFLGFTECVKGSAEELREQCAFVTDIRQGRAVLLVDGFLAEEEVFVKSLHPPLSDKDSLTGITVLGSGRPVLVIDPSALGREIRSKAPAAEAIKERSGE